MSTTKFDARRTKPQHLTNYMGKPLEITYSGRCIGCGSRVFDGGEDPRGVVPSKHFNSGATFEEGAIRMDFPACDDCMNDEPRYLRVMRRAEMKSRRAAQRMGATASE